MNKRRRIALNKALDLIEELNAAISKDEVMRILQAALKLIEQCEDEEQMALDNRPESLMWSATTEAMTDNVSDLSEAAGDIEVLLEQCQNMDSYDYKDIQEDVIKIVNTIKQTIHR